MCVALAAAADLARIRRIRNIATSGEGTHTFSQPADVPNELTKPRLGCPPLPAVVVSRGYWWPLFGENTNGQKGSPALSTTSSRFTPWVTDTATWITRRQPRTRRRRDAIVNAASLAASCDISILMSRNWLALMGSQRWICDARGCNCSAKNQL
jgi:hypothetical protein